MSSVFVSYARGDDEPFVARLSSDLKAQNFEVWWDRLSMSARGLTFLQEIRDAIGNAERFVVVLGPEAKASAYVNAEMRHASIYGKPFNPVLRIGEFEDVPAELRRLHIEDFRDDDEYQLHLRNLIRQLSEPSAPMGELIGMPGLPANVLPRGEQVRALRAALLADLHGPVTFTGADSRLGLHGMGGIGKSVLANLLARDVEVRRAFPDGVVWVPFGHEPDLAKLQRDVLREFSEPGDSEGVEQGRVALSRLLDSRAVLLILDDVWERTDAGAFDVLGPRCRAVVTTRDGGLLDSQGGARHEVQLLSADECVQLLAEGAAVSRDELPAEAAEIIAECGRLPLAVALCAGMVKRGVPWRRVLARLTRAALENIGDRNADNQSHRSLWTAIQVSVDALTPEERSRFAELSIFRTGEAVPAAAVEVLWSRSGQLDEFAYEELLLSLNERSLVRLVRETSREDQQIHYRVSLHDLVHDFARRIVGDARPLHGTLVEAYRRRCREDWSAGPNDGYFFEQLSTHMRLAGAADHLYAVARSEEFLRTQLTAVPYRPDLPHRTMTDALRAAAESDDAAKMVEFFLRLAQQTECDAPETPLSALQAGAVGRAWRLADLARPAAGHSWHVLICWELFDQGNRSELAARLADLRRQQISFPEWTTWPAVALAEMARGSSQSEIDATAGLLTGELRKVFERSRESAGAHVRPARVQPPEGDLAAAFEVAIQRVKSMAKPPTWKYREFYYEQNIEFAELARRQAAAGLHEEATETASLINADFPRDETLADIARSQAAVGDFDDAFQTVTKMKHARMRGPAMSGLLEQLTATHGLPSARAKILDTLAVQMAGMRDDQRRNESAALGVLSERLGDQQLYGHALEVAKNVVEESDRSRAFERVGIRMAQEGLVDGAIEILNPMDPYYRKQRGIRAVADALAGRESIDVAVAFAKQQLSPEDYFSFVADTSTLDVADRGEYFRRAQQIVQAEDRARVPARIDYLVELLLRDNRISDATLVDAERRSRSFRLWICQDRISARDYDGLKREIKDWDLDQRLDALKKVALAQSDEGRLDEAKSTLSMAVNVCSMAMWEDAIARRLAEVAEVAAEVGDIEFAKTCFRNAQNKLSWMDSSKVGARVGGLRHIAGRQATAGLYDDAKETGRRIGVDFEFQGLLTEIAAAQAKAGHLAEALETAESIGDVELQAVALVAIATTQAARGQTEDALLTARRIQVRHDANIPAIARAFAERRDRESFKELLIALPSSTAAAYRMSAIAIDLYPDAAADVAGSVLAMRQGVESRR